MGLRDVAVYAIILAAAQAFLLVQFAPQLRPTGGLGRLAFRFFFVNVLVYLFWSVLIYPFFLSPLRHIPGPKDGSLLFGHALQARLKKPRGDLIRQWMEDIPNDGILRFRDAFNQYAIIPTSHATMKTILNDNNYDYVKPLRVAQLLRSILGDGLILVEGDDHKFQRKHLHPSFQTKVIRELYPTFWAKARELAYLLDESVNEEEVELGVWCTRVTLDIIGIAGFGRDFNSLKNPTDEFVADFQNVLEPSPPKALFFVLSLMFPFWLTSRIPFWNVPKNLTRISRSLYLFAYNLARERRAELTASKTERRDILSLLVRSNDFSDHELAHQALTMMAAGHETTSSTLSWCLYFLACYPEVQTQLRQEVRAAVALDSEIDAGTIDAMPLLNAVCNETLRLYPTVPVTSREVVHPTRLGNFVLPVGTTIFICPWAINRRTEFWGEDAMEFRPQRWIDDEKGGASSTYSSITFLHGPRSCIGQVFARSELKCLLAVLVGRFEFALTRDQSTYFPAGVVTTKPAQGMWMKLKKVDGW